ARSRRSRLPVRSIRPPEGARRLAGTKVNPLSPDGEPRACGDDDHAEASLARGVPLAAVERSPPSLAHPPARIARPATQSLPAAPGARRALRAARRGRAADRAPDQRAAAARA